VKMFDHVLEFDEICLLVLICSKKKIYEFQLRWVPIKSFRIGENHNFLIYIKYGKYLDKIQNKFLIT